MHFLIIVANFYEDIASNLLKGASNELDKQGHSYHKISVPGCLEIPATISFASDTLAYDGFIALGCIIKGETIHHKVVAYESARAINDLAINMNLAVANGIITVENKKQALSRSVEKNKGAYAAKTAITMAKIRDKFHDMLIS
jgi:6,7-dimethyl-8-ribityllumazine synthase